VFFTEQHWPTFIDNDARPYPEWKWVRQEMPADYGTINEQRRIKAIEYHENGLVKRIEYFAE
jgi:hypothetical protein